jgi:dTDP-4-dehydrorhamnose reductase
MIVIGASGLIGWQIVDALKSDGHDVTGTYLHYPCDGKLRLDIRESAAVEELVRAKNPEIIFLPAAIADVDLVQAQPERTYPVNVTGVYNVVRAANKSGARIVYFSSDYVFDGLSGPYVEEDLPNPISAYGIQKLLAEYILALYAQSYLLIRTTIVYGWEHQRKNFVYKVLNSLSNHQILKVPLDQVGTPTYCPDLVRAAIKLSLDDEQGTFHIVGSERINRFEFACQIAECFSLDQSLLQPVITAELGQLAPRPLNAGLRNAKAQGKLSFELSSSRRGLTEFQKVLGR